MLSKSFVYHIQSMWQDQSPTKTIFTFAAISVQKKRRPITLNLHWYLICWYNCFTPIEKSCPCVTDLSCRRGINMQYDNCCPQLSSQIHNSHYRYAQRKIIRSKCGHSWDLNSYKSTFHHFIQSWKTAVALMEVHVTDAASEVDLFHWWLLLCLLSLWQGVLQLGRVLFLPRPGHFLGGRSGEAVGPWVTHDNKRTWIGSSVNQKAKNVQNKDHTWLAIYGMPNCRINTLSFYLLSKTVVLPLLWCVYCPNIKWEVVGRLHFKENPRGQIGAVISSKEQLTVYLWMRMNTAVTTKLITADEWFLQSVCDHPSLN